MRVLIATILVLSCTPNIMFGTPAKLVNPTMAATVTGAVSEIVGLTPIRDGEPGAYYQGLVELFYRKSVKIIDPPTPIQDD